jgi:hypothetical protein
MLAATDIHKAVFQAAVLDTGTGETIEERFKASTDALSRTDFHGDRISSLARILQ